MIRPFTLLTALLAMGAGAYLFAVKHRAQVLDDQLATVTEQSRLDGQRIRVLQAQWALEIDPTRLGQLATQFTTLQPMKPAQLVTLAALAHVLPAPGTAAPGQNPQGAMPSLGQPDAFTTVIAANGLPLPPPAMPAADVMDAAPVALASAAPVAATAVSAPAAAAHTVRLAAVRRAVRPGPTRLAQNLPAAAPAYDPRPYQPAPPRLQPLGAQVVSVNAIATPAAQPAYVQRADIRPSYMQPSYVAPPAPPQPAGSMLGMAADTLPPPQPLGADN